MENEPEPRHLTSESVLSISNALLTFALLSYLASRPRTSISDSISQTRQAFSPWPTQAPSGHPLEFEYANLQMVVNTYKKRLIVDLASVS